MRLLWANVIRATLTSGMGAAFIFIGKLFICVITVIICYEIIEHDSDYSGVTSSYIPCLIIFVIAYTVGVIFMTVYGMAIDTIL